MSLTGRYDESYADTRSWVQQGLLDYTRRRSTGRLLAMPRAMMCWPKTGGPRWLKPTHTRLYIGVALYKVGEPSKK
ncbi:hypothetical protein BCR59_27595 [Klebsiella pneumoniae]|nr:hypothetical protein BCR59_27595 [Klebsiella pneumoniae]